MGRKLIELKRLKPAGIRDWRAYVTKFFYNKAANWVRDHRAREKRYVPLPDAETFFAGAGLSESSESDFSLAFKEAWLDLPKDLQTLGQILLEEDGNQVAVAKRLRKHRNTVRLWIRKIKQHLGRQGF